MAPFCFIGSGSRSRPGTSGVGVLLFCLGFLLFSLFLFPKYSFGRIYIDINAPSIRKFKIAIPDFKNLSNNNEHPELAAALPAVITNDLDFSGYFSPMDKAAFLEEEGDATTLESIRFKDWSVIGATLLLGSVPKHS